MFWNQSKAVNRAAKTIRSFLSENKIELTQAQALDLVARLQGFPNHMSANAALKKQEVSEETALKSWNDLWQFIATMSEEQRKASITVSEGCDENGNAEFFDATSIVKATASCIEAASDGVLDKDDHVLLFNTNIDPDDQHVPTTEFADKATRFALQCELNEWMEGPAAYDLYVQAPNYAMETVPGAELGDWVIFHDSEGYYNTSFGFVGNRGSASGWDTEFEAKRFLEESCVAYLLANTANEKAMFQVLHCPGKEDWYPQL